VADPGIKDVVVELRLELGPNRCQAPIGVLA
jgi:hypothetical protein